MPIGGGNIVDVKYDSVNRGMTVYFSSGSKYFYEGVPYARYSEMLEAKSRSDFFNNRIKDVFKFKRIY